MNFIVPQFIEEETKIIGFLNFKQIIFIGTAIAICVVLWFTIKNSFVFYPLAFVILGTGTTLALLKIKRTPLPIIIKNYFIFIFKPKIYLWRKKEAKQVLSTIKKEAVKVKIPEKKEKVSLVKKSHLQNLFTEIESKK